MTAAGGADSGADVTSAGERAGGGRGAALSNDVDVVVSDTLLLSFKVKLL